MTSSKENNKTIKNVKNNVTRGLYKVPYQVQSYLIRTQDNNRDHLDQLSYYKINENGELIAYIKTDIDTSAKPAFVCADEVTLMTNWIMPKKIISGNIIYENVPFVFNVGTDDVYEINQLHKAVRSRNL